jgi:lincosamide nucleotidyltransferase A/C/D/E
VVFDGNGNGVQSGLDGYTFLYPAIDLTTGQINGRAVPCISARLQRNLHSGYDPRPQDLHDLQLLESLDALQ